MRMLTRSASHPFHLLAFIKAGAAKQSFSITRTSSSMQATYRNVLAELDLDADKVIPAVWDGNEWRASGEEFVCVNPTNQDVLGTVRFGTASDYERCVDSMLHAKRTWISTPAPKRGEIVRQIGLELRRKQTALGKLLCMEMGKILAEGVGEVQEFIDMCDLAAGMSRQIPGHVFPSERSDHIMLETWWPLGTVGIITAFNFPNAVAGWNSSVSLVCGNTQILKGAETASLMNVALQKIIVNVLRKNDIPLGVATLCQGYGNEIGERIIQDKRINLVSFTGSTSVGKRVSEVVSSRFGRTILELGGNNAIVVMPNANIEMALRSVLFAAVGTCGQRCTSLRRLLLHNDIYDEFIQKLKDAYSRVKIGNPLNEGVIVGPLHSNKAMENFDNIVKIISQQRGKLLYGGTRVNPKDLPEDVQAGNFVYPTLVEIDSNASIVQEENFVPILYVLRFKNLEEAIELNNSVEQGLTSALFSNDMRDVFQWMGPNGSDTGIINVNTSCSGAEIGGAFGGNKSTGGGRESGSDSWKQYMRRGTCTINYGNDLPLAQGLDFS